MTNHNEDIDMSRSEEMLLREATNRALSDNKPDIDRELSLIHI